MGYFSLRFENAELELQYQREQQKYVQRCAYYYFLILMIGKWFSVIDQLIYQQYFFFSVTLVSILFEMVLLQLIRQKKLNTMLIQLYTTGLCIIAIGLQFFNYYLKDNMHFTQSQYFVWLDIVHQCIILVNYGQSHVLSSIIYVIFIISRILIQMTYGYSTLSLTFLVYGAFYIIDQYQKAKQRRKQFLKGLKNKLLEEFVQDFIEEQVCILQKDEENVKFTPILINNKFTEKTNDINILIKQLQVCNLQESLQNYLYKTTQIKETVLCKYQDRVYELTYQRYIIKKCKIFLKIKEIYQNHQSLVNFKDLYSQYRNKLQKLTRNNYKAQQLTQQLEASMFIYWFQKYYCIYKLKLEKVEAGELLNLFAKKYQIIQSNFNCNFIITDKFLIKLLFKTLKKCIDQCQVIVNYGQSHIVIKFVGVINLPITNYHKDLINKILFHIGIGKLEILENLDRACIFTINLCHIESLSFKYQ